MTNLFPDQGDELCFITVEDVRDSLGGVFAENDGEETPTYVITDEEIEALIITAQDSIRCYLGQINAEFCTDDACPICTPIPGCDDVPIDIQRATLLAVQEIYNQVLAGTTGSANKQIVKESSCGVSVEYKVDEDVTIPCLPITCEIERLMCKYEKKGGKKGLYGPCCSSGCGRGCCNNTPCQI